MNVILTVWHILLCGVTCTIATMYCYCVIYIFICEVIVLFCMFVLFIMSKGRYTQFITVCYNAVHEAS